MHFLRLSSCVLLYASLFGCAVLHRTTISEIVPVSKPQVLDLKASEMGFDIQGAARLSGNLMQRHGNANAGKAGQMLNFVVALSSWSPKTGNPTVSEDWADTIGNELRKQCPKGRIVNLMVLRESASYPLVIGEIARVKADCERK